MSKTRISNKENKDNQHYSDTCVIHDQLQLQQKSFPGVTVATDEETLDAHAKMCAYRDIEIQHIAEDAQLIKQMFQDFAQLTEEQQPIIENVAKSLQSANKHVENTEEALIVVADKGNKCIIS